MSTTDLTVPNIGDVTDVDVLEVLVEVGDTIAPDQSLITVESDKASMEIPAAQGGVVSELLVALRHKVSEGSPIARIVAAEADGAGSKAAQTAVSAVGARDDKTREDKPPDATGQASTTPSQPAAEQAPARDADTVCDVVVIGAGPGGYSAAFRAADLGLDVVLVERYNTLGGVCLNVGCIPSKALLHTAGVFEAAQALAEQGISFGKPDIDLDALRTHKEQVVGKLTTGLAGRARARKVKVVTGTASFLDGQHLSIDSPDADSTTLRFGSAIIAAGSEAIALPFLPQDDDRIMDSTGALELRSIPESMLVVGGGIIGLEMATVYSALGTRIDIVEMEDSLMAGPDRDLVK